MAARSVAKRRSRKGGHGRRVVGVMMVGGEWRFVVQVFTTANEQEPVVCMFYRLEDLTGNLRRKASRWRESLRPLEPRKPISEAA